MQLNILLVDDHEVVRDGIKALLKDDSRFGSVDIARNGQQAILKMSRNDYQVVVMDYDMPEMNGVLTSKELIKIKPGIGILMLSLYNDKAHMYEAIQSGIMGYLTKESSSLEVIDAIVAIGRGEHWFKGKIAELVTSYLLDHSQGKRKPAEQSVITRREEQILKLVAKGMRSSEIAEILSISRRTVEVHRTNILKKLHLKNTAELMWYAIHNKIIQA